MSKRKSNLSSRRGRQRKLSGEILEKRRLLSASADNLPVSLSTIHQYGTALFGFDWQDDVGLGPEQIQQHIQSDTWRSMLNDSPAPTIARIRTEAQYLGAETLQAMVDQALESANLSSIDIRELDWLQEQLPGPAENSDFFADGQSTGDSTSEGEPDPPRGYIKYQEGSVYEGNIMVPGVNGIATVIIGFEGELPNGGFNVPWQATGQTATAGADFTPTSGSVTFTDGAEGEKSVPISIINDTIDEPNETFRVNLQGNVVPGKGHSVITILENDLHISIFDADPVTENDVPIALPPLTQPMSRFRVTISSPRADYVSIPWRAVPVPVNSSLMPATPGVDFSVATTSNPAVNGWLVFEPGQTERFIELPIIGDQLYELTEYFFVEIATEWLHHIFYTVDNHRGLGTIHDNDPYPELSVNDVSVEESAGTATLTVTMINRSSFPVSFNWAVTDQTAIHPDDYGRPAATGTTTIPAGGGPGPHLEQFVFTIVNDQLTEPAETFRLTISNAVNANISKANGTVTILANDPQVDIDVDSNNDGTITEADDPIEMNAPGKFVRWNRDDDNGNGILDYLENGPLTAPDDDLVPINLSFIQSGLSQAYLDRLRVRLSGNYTNGSIRIWDTQTKNNLIPSDTTWSVSHLPNNLYMEAVSATSLTTLVLILEEQQEYFTSLVHFDSVLVTAATPSIVITHLQVVDTLGLDGQPINPGVLDESEILIVHGIMKGLVANESLTGFVGVDFNLDGDFDDPDERVSIQGVGLETLFSALFYVKDDGLVLGTPGNITTSDSLQIEARVVSQLGGIALTNSSIEVYNITPSFETYPYFEFVLAEDGLTVVNAKIKGKIFDPGLYDYHQLTITLPPLFFPITGPIILAPIERSFSIDIPIVGTRIVGDFAGVHLAMRDDDSGVAEFGLSAMSITAKSFINGTILNNGDGIGAFPFGDNYDSAASANIRLATFAGTAMVYQEDPQGPSKYTDTFPPYTGESYRLLSRINVQFGFQNGKVVAVKQIGEPILDGGLEGPFHGTIDIRGLQIMLNTNGIATLRWMGFGKPDPLVEPFFNAVANRNSKYIWHLIEATATVSNGSILVTPYLRGSRFPSHRLWVNTTLTNGISQSQFVNLWEELRPSAMLELSQLLNVPAASFAEFVTEEDDGLYVSQATPNSLLPIYGPWNPHGN